MYIAILNHSYYTVDIISVSRDTIDNFGTVDEYLSELGYDIDNIEYMVSHYRHIEVNFKTKQ